MGLDAGVAPLSKGNDAMSVCTNWSLVKHGQNVSAAKMLYCRSWNCETCRPKRKRQLLARAAAGRPNRFITLTASPTSGTNPRDRLRVLAHAWRTAVKRLHRMYPLATIDYLAVVEATKKGEPHLHILYRGPYIAQRTLSRWFAELASSPIVDIRAIKHQREVVRYVGKYITKKPAQFGTAKRYWSSYHYNEPFVPQPFAVVEHEAPWLLSRVHISVLSREYKDRGYQVWQMEPDGIYMVRSP